jgi:hypothetical protein
VKDVSARFPIGRVDDRELAHILVLFNRVRSERIAQEYENPKSVRAVAAA